MPPKKLTRCNQHFYSTLLRLILDAFDGFTLGQEAVDQLECIDLDRPIEEHMKNLETLQAMFYLDQEILLMLAMEQLTESTQEMHYNLRLKEEKKKCNTETEMTKEDEEKIEEKPKYKRCRAQKVGKKKVRCANKVVPGFKLCKRHRDLEADIKDWSDDEESDEEEEKKPEGELTEKEKIERNIIRAALNGIFYLPNTSYRLDKDQYVISRDTFEGDRLDVVVNPLTQQDIEWLTKHNKKYRLIDWENRKIEDIPKADVFRDITLADVPKTVIKPQKNRKSRSKPGEESDMDDPEIPEEFYEQFR